MIRFEVAGCEGRIAATKGVGLCGVAGDAADRQSF
jgi:hypothetical protein